MAEEIIFKVGIDSDGSGAKSLKSLKAEFKQLQAELEKTEVGTKAYQQTLQRLGNVRDEIGDLNQTINALNPEGKVQAFANVAGKLAGGFQAATGAAALFGVQSEELEKTLLRVQAATALSQGIQSVVGLTDAFKVLGSVIAANPIMFLAGAIAAITAATIYWVNATDEATLANERLNKTLEQQTGLIGQLESFAQNRLKQLKNQGATEREILEETIALNKTLFEERVKQQETTAKLVANGDKEAAKAYGAIFQARIDAELNVQSAVKALEDFDRKEREDAHKKSEERKKETAIRVHKEQIAERKILDEQAALAAQAQQDEFDEIFKQLEKEQQENDLTAYLDYEWNRMLASLDVEKRGAAQKKQIDDKNRAEKEKADAEALNRQYQIQSNYFNAVADLSSFYFNTQLAQSLGNAKKEEELRKKQFQVEKAFRAAQATIDTYKAINATLATGGALATPLAVSIGIAGFANVAKIISQQYQGGNISGSQSDININAPQLQTQAPVTGTPLTRLNEQGRNLEPVRAYVVETDVSESQQRIRRLEEQATF